MAEILEAVMLICFGLSWPMNAWKSFKARTAAGTSWQFLGLITLGYVAGIAAKFVSGNLNWVLIVYFFVFYLHFQFQKLLLIYLRWCLLHFLF